ncbi:Riboflavin transporter MCH5 [Leucoagaricus sp. SymC.cos]|nr:Riboflavin transporter MCH5 [Leucoagaricus sp. SymC.cos]
MAEKPGLNTSTNSTSARTTEDPVLTSTLNGIYSEGPRKAWSTVIGACLVQICAIGILSSYGVFQDFYTREWLSKSSTSAISWIGSTQIFLEYFLAPIGGELLDRGYFRSLVVVGCSLYLFSFFMLSFTAPQSFYQVFLAQAVGMGLGVGILFLPTSVVAIRHFKRNQALGIVDSTISLGGLIFSIVLNYLIHSHLGFAWGIRAVTLITLICFLAGVFLMSMPGSENGKKEPNAPVRSSWREVAISARKDWPYLLVIGQAFTMCLGTFVPSFYLQLFAVTHGTSKQASFYALSILNFSGVFGRIIPNHLGDRYGVLKVYIPCLVTTGALCFAMLGAGRPTGLFPFAIFYGFFFGATNGMYLSIINSLSTGTSADQLWKRCGLSLIPPAVAALIGSPITGSILGSNYQWWRGILFASVGIFVPFNRGQMLNYVIPFFAAHDSGCNMPGNWCPDNAHQEPKEH